jgi:hypothetical protein
MTVPPDAKHHHCVDTRVYEGATSIADAESEEVYGLDYRHRERDEKEKKSGEKGGEDRKQRG